jgi:hypothetical protein
MDSAGVAGKIRGEGACEICVERGYSRCWSRSDTPGQVIGMRPMPALPSRRPPASGHGRDRHGRAVAPDDWPRILQRDRGLPRNLRAGSRPRVDRRPRTLVRRTAADGGVRRRMPGPSRGDHAARRSLGGRPRNASQWGWDPQPGLAQLRLAQGRTAAAVAAIRRVVGETTARAQRTVLLAAQVEIRLGAGDIACFSARRPIPASTPSDSLVVLRALVGFRRGRSRRGSRRRSYRQRLPPALTRSVPQVHGRCRRAK